MNKVYILKNPEGITKIGFTSTSAECRREQIASSMCSKFSAVAYFDNPKTPARQLEKMVHNLCSNYRVAIKDCRGNNCFEFYNLPNEVLAFVMLYLAEATCNKLDYHEFARQVPYKADVKKALTSLAQINNAIDEGFVLKAGYNRSGADRYESTVDALLPTHQRQGFTAFKKATAEVSNRLVLRFNRKNVQQFRFTQKKQKKMPTFQTV